MNYKEILNKTVNVHFNLHTKLWSVKYKGKIINLSGFKYVVIEPEKFHVNENGRQRVIRKKCREVHAWVKGKLISLEEKPETFHEGISYNPYYSGFFYEKKDMREAVITPGEHFLFDFESKYIHRV